MSEDPLASNPTFESLFARVTATSDGFGHREHVHLTWLAVHACGTDSACTLVSEGLRKVTRYARMPQKYHATMSRAWVLLIAHHVIAHPTGDFTKFIEGNQALLDKRLLSRFYRSSTLAGTAARTSWVEPDLAPLPGDR